MLATGDYANVQIGFEPFREKPPLFFWLQALCMGIFGVNEFAARLPNALCGTATLLTLFYIGFRLKDHRFGLLWALVYVASFLPHFYFKFGVIDPVFNLFIFLSIHQTILSVEERKFNRKNALYAGLFSGLAVLTKGPVGLLLLILTFGAYHAVTRLKRFPKFGYFLWFALSFSLVVSSWFAMNIITNGWDLFWQFINYQVELFTQPVAGHEQPFYYHFLVVLLGCLPMSLYALPAFRSKIYGTRTPYNFRLWMLSLFWVVMILFTITTTKIVHYSSMAYLPLSFLATTVLFRYEEKHRPIHQVLNGSVLGLSLLFGVLLTVLPFVFNKKDKWINLLSKDPFAQVSFSLPVEWPWWICIAGLLFILASVIGFVWRQTGKFYPALAINAAATGLVLISTFWLVLPRIERYTQGPAIDFIEQKAGSNAYVTTYGYKSYANFFYFQYPNQADKQTDDANYLLTHPMDKPVFLIARCTNKELDANPNVKFIKQEGGFRFYQKIQ